MQVNDILVSKWGYEQTNVNFYKVLKVTKTMVEIQELEKISQPYTDMSNYEMPTDKTKGKILRRKIHNAYNEEFIYINSYSLAKKWNHKKQLSTSYS